MAELVQLIPDENDETDRRILELRVAGSSVLAIAKQLGLSRHEISHRIDRGLPTTDASFLRRSVALSLLRIDELTETFHKLAKTGDIEAGNLMVRLEAERRALLGLTGSNYNPIQLSQQACSAEGETSMSAITRGLDMIESLRRLTNEKPSAPAPHGAPDCGASSDMDADESS